METSCRAFARDARIERRDAQPSTTDHDMGWRIRREMEGPCLPVEVIPCRDFALPFDRDPGPVRAPRRLWMARRLTIAAKILDELRKEVQPLPLRLRVEAERRRIVRDRPFRHIRDVAGISVLIHPVKRRPVRRVSAKNRPRWTVIATVPWQRRQVKIPRPVGDGAQDGGWEEPGVLNGDDPIDAQSLDGFDESLGGGIIDVNEWDADTRQARRSPPANWLGIRHDSDSQIADNCVTRFANGLLGEVKNPHRADSMRGRTDRKYRSCPSGDR